MSLITYEADPGSLYFALSSALANDENTGDTELAHDFVEQGLLTKEQANEVIRYRRLFESVDFSYQAGCEVFEVLRIKNYQLI